MKFYVQYFPITKSFGRIANANNISLDSFRERVRASDEFCNSIVMSVLANSIRDVENNVNFLERFCSKFPIGTRE